MPPPLPNPDYSTPPPPLPPPPIVSGGSPVSPRKTGRGWKILSVLLLVFIGLIFFSFFAAPSEEEKLHEIVWENNHSKNKIAIIEVEGIIASSPLGRSGISMVESIQEQLKTAARDPNVRAVILKVNSPGGEVLASDEIYTAIRDFQNTYKKPVVASMGSLAASGGYYVSAPCRWIVANEMTLTGSIGVIMHGYNYRGLMDKIGIRPDVYKSGKHKDMLSGDRRDDEIPADEREMVQGLIMETYGKFTNIVATGRGEANQQNKGTGHKLATDWSDYADGRVVSGKQALDLGLVDQLGNFPTAVQRAREIANISDADLIRYEQPFGLGNLLRIFGKSEVPAPSVKIDFGLEMPKLQLGRLYFIAPSTLP
ncbi:MAG: signal peptide peptidase SppA [Verrucomicrobiota bacterium]